MRSVELRTQNVELAETEMKQSQFCAPSSSFFALRSKLS